MNRSNLINSLETVAINLVSEALTSSGKVHYKEGAHKSIFGRPFTYKGGKWVSDKDSSRFSGGSKKNGRSKNVLRGPIMLLRHIGGAPTTTHRYGGIYSRSKFPTRVVHSKLKKFGFKKVKSISPYADELHHIWKHPKYGVITVSKSLHSTPDLSYNRNIKDAVEELNL